MKKWMIIAAAMILAGCGDVSVEDTAKTASNPSPGSSGGCQSDDDCAGNTVDKRCDTSRHICVQCIENAQCDSNACTEGKCETAVCEEDCGKNEKVCDANTRECVECLKDGDCAEHENGQFCDQSKKVCVECVKNEDCGKDEICAKDNTCKNDEQKFDCTDLVPQCIEKLDKTGFTLHLVCSGTTSFSKDVGCECKDEHATSCIGEADCKTGYLRQCKDDKSIVFGCRDNAGEEGILTDSVQLYECDHYCADDASGPHCVECLSNEHCVEGFCHEKENRCVECLADSDCVDKICNATTYRCEDCPENQVLLDGVCQSACDLNVIKEYDNSIDDDYNENNTFIISDIDSLNDWNDDSNWSEKRKEHLIICGAIQLGSTVDTMVAPEGVSIVGVNPNGEMAKILAKSDDDDLKMTKPLFASLKKATVSNLEIQMDMMVTGEKYAHGLLSNEITESKIENIRIVNSTIKNKMDSAKINDFGVLTGMSKEHSEINHVQLENVIVSFEPPSDYKSLQCESAKGHARIGGLVGHATETNIVTPIIHGLQMDIGRAAHVGGVVGKANNSNISGFYDGENKSEFEISEITIKNAERDVGGIAGIFNGGQISNFNLNVKSLEAKLPCVGGMVGYYEVNKNANNIIKDSNIIVAEVLGGRYVGGVVGLQDFGSSLEITNVDVQTGAVNAVDFSDCEKPGEFDGKYAGGVVGSIRNIISFDEANIGSNGKLNITSVNNVFDEINADYYAGGLIGGVNGIGSLNVDDVINKCSQSVCVKASHYAGGFMGTAGDNVQYELNRLYQLQIKNVINEVSSVTADEYAAGFIASIRTNAQKTERKIQNVISNVGVNNKRFGGGFIGQMSLLHNDNNASFEIKNILSKSNLTARDVGGFVYEIGRLEKNELDNYLNEFYKINTNVPCKIMNILNETNDAVKENNIMMSIKKVAMNCPVTDIESYSRHGNALKEIIRNVFKNVFYSMPGYSNDVFAVTDHPLIWCGNVSDKACDYNKNNNKSDSNCQNFRGYKTPIRECWFTDYIYHKGFNCYDDSIGLLNSLKSISSIDDIPFNLYHPYSADLENSGFDNINKENSNADAVIRAMAQLNEQEQFIWKKISDGQPKQLTMNYEDLIYPVLTGRLTCMGTWDDVTEKCIVPQ